jgi:hypothetical protein
MVPTSGNLLGDPLGPEIHAGLFFSRIRKVYSTFINFKQTLDSWALFGSAAWQLSAQRITGLNADGSLNVAAA